MGDTLIFSLDFMLLSKQVSEIHMHELGKEMIQILFYCTFVNPSCFEMIYGLLACGGLTQVQHQLAKPIPTLLATLASARGAQTEVALEAVWGVVEQSFRTLEMVVMSV